MQRSIQAGIAARIGKYSDAVEVTDSQGMRTLYVSGTPGLDAQTGHVPEDFAAQADLAWRNLEAILAAADMSVDDIVKLTVYVKDDTVRDAVNTEWLECFPDPPDRPARHILVVDLKHGMWLQLEVTAVTS